MRPKKLVNGAIAFLRENFPNDGAEGESVHLVCAELEEFRTRSEYLASVLREVHAHCDNNAIWFKNVDLAVHGGGRERDVSALPVAVGGAGASGGEGGEVEG